ncbi:MAG: Gx transporter family protein [Treponema sp.]|jgi:heptaprenyl diphosphate synthase|nr:Gx transporter family protein [Treponema sp.]
MTKKARPGDLVPVFAALCLFLAAFEYLIPKPLPFLRLGLANLPLLLALPLLAPADFFLLAGIKTAGQALLSGTLLSYVTLFSLGGTAASSAVMFLLYRLFGRGPRPLLGFPGLGIAGALASNGAQLALARGLVFGPQARLLAPPFLAAGLVTGCALGLFCDAFSRRSGWIRDLGEKNALSPPLGGVGGGSETNPDPSLPSPKGRRDAFSPPLTLFCAGLGLAAVFLVTPSLESRIMQFLLFWGTAVREGKRTRPLVMLGTALAVILCNLAAPYGELLFRAGPLAVTRGALEAGVRKALNLEGLMMLSRVCVSRGLRFPGRAGAVLAASLALLERLSGQALSAGRAALKKKGLFAGLDAALFSLWNG